MQCPAQLTLTCVVVSSLIQGTAPGKPKAKAPYLNLEAAQHMHIQHRVCFARCTEGTVTCCVQPPQVCPSTSSMR